jgi:hypothetical protein
MDENVKISILPSGHIKFRRGDKKYNDKVKEILMSLIDDEKIINELDSFFDELKEVDVIVGNNTFCG